MNQLQDILDLFATQNVQFSIEDFLINLMLAAVLGFILSYIYIRYGKSLSNRKLLARNFILLIMTTMFIITIVKSSLALSLGLVGALSIVRFRAAIKEPEELVYLFFAISIGLGLGASQRAITLVSFFVIIIIIWLINFSSRKEKNQNIYLTISCNNPSKISLDVVIGVLKKYCTSVNLKRFDETKEALEASFFVDFPNPELLNKSRAKLKELDNSIKITLLDNKSIG
ncbi:DUF4956 domain-containing protein [Patescibacteria group bacterium]|nr:DUF4956 domain-containing protein [Patescibacteria group bacterium]